MTADLLPEVAHEAHVRDKAFVGWVGMRIDSPSDGAKVHGLCLHQKKKVQAQLMQLAALVAGGCFEGVRILMRRP